MLGVLVLAHGSRVQATKDTINKVADMVREEIKDVPILVGYMEFCEENIEKSVNDLVAQGVDHIKVVPYFLFEGIHIRKDIPEELEAALEKHPGVTYEMGKTLGADPRLASILADRIRN